jgi:hypothetical protein
MMGLRAGGHMRPLGRRKLRFVSLDSPGAHAGDLHVHEITTLPSALILRLHPTVRPFKRHHRSTGRTYPDRSVHSICKRIRYDEFGISFRRSIADALSPNHGPIYGWSRMRYSPKEIGRSWGRLHLSTALTHDALKVANNFPFNLL